MIFHCWLFKLNLALTHKKSYIQYHQIDFEKLGPKVGWIPMISLRNMNVCLFLWSNHHICFCRRLVERLEGLRHSQLGNGDTDCILCGEVFRFYHHSQKRCVECGKMTCGKCGREYSLNIATDTKGKTKIVPLLLLLFTYINHSFKYISFRMIRIMKMSVFVFLTFWKFGNQVFSSFSNFSR